MKIVKWFFYVILPMVLIGAILQHTNLFPNYLNDEYDNILTKITLLCIAIAFVYLAYFLFLNSRNREGFADQQAITPVDRWKTMSQENSLQPLCSLLEAMEAKMIPVEKGAPPDQKTDAQARESVQQEFQKGNLVGLFSCAQFKKVEAAQDLEQFFTVIQEVPDTFLAEAHSTANVALNLLLKQKEKMTEASVPPSNVRVAEGFRDVSTKVCSPDIVEQRRKFLREKKLSEEAEQCLLPEEVPADSKESAIAQKLDKIQQTYLEYLAYVAKPVEARQRSRPPFVRPPSQELVDQKVPGTSNTVQVPVSTEILYPVRNQSIDKIMEQAQIIQTELEQSVKDAESGKTISQMNLS